MTDLFGPESLGQPFWEGAAAGRLVLQWCAQCGRYAHFPLPTCRHCHGADALGWRELSGRAVVYTFTIVHRTRYPAFRDRVPYAVVCGELVEQAALRMYANLVHSELSDLRIGSELQVVFEEQDGVVLPQFVLA